MKTKKYQLILSMTGAALLFSTPLTTATVAAADGQLAVAAGASRPTSTAKQAKADALLNNLLGEQAALANAQAALSENESAAAQSPSGRNETKETAIENGEISDPQATTVAPDSPTDSSTATAVTTRAAQAQPEINIWMPNRELQQLVLNNLQRQGVAVTSVDQIHSEEMAQLEWLSNEPMTDPGEFAPFSSELVPKYRPNGEYELDGLRKAVNLKSIVLKGLGQPQRRGNIRSLTPLVNLRHLETIDVSGNQIQSTDELLFIQSLCPQFKSLDISNNSIGDFSGIRQEKLQQFKYKGQIVVTNNTGVLKGETTETYDLARVIKPVKGETLERQFDVPQLNFNQYQRLDLAMPAGRPQNKISVYENGAAQGNGSVSGFKVTYEGLAEQEAYPGLPPEFAGQTDLPHKYRYAMFANLYQRGETDQPVATIIIPYHDTDLIGERVFVQSVDENGKSIGDVRFVTAAHPDLYQQGYYKYPSYAGYVDQKEPLAYRVTDEPQTFTAVYHPMLRTQDRKIARGSAWTVKDNLTQVRTKEGAEVPLAKLDLDQNKIKVTIASAYNGKEYTEAEVVKKTGEYTVTYTYDDKKFKSHLTVADQLTTIVAHDLTIKANEAWSPAAHFDSATAQGIALSLEDLDVDASSVDLAKPGVYQVIFTIPAALNGGTPYQRTVTLTVEANNLEAPPVDPETPEVPEQPEKPTPEEPETPTPEQPEKPTPEQPEKPTPEEPNKPTPEEPETPTPEEPNKPTPEEPEKPTPEEPEKPTPEEPETPTPEEPEKPTPEQPEKPTPEEPETPTPEQPEKPTPEEPETPVNPENPGDSEAPEQPEAPADPETVPDPVTPSEPQDPQNPATPDLITPTPQPDLPSTPWTPQANDQQGPVLPQANERHASVLTALGTLALLLTGFAVVRGLWKIVKPR
ncbi:bacterial Ig-like domain-containing protein [Lapidilactobacillus salsurivasis]